MNLCEHVERALVAGEALGVSEQGHLERCPICRQTAADLEGIVGAAEPLAAFGPSPPAELTRLRAAIGDRGPGAPWRSRRWVAVGLGAGLAMAVVLAVVHRLPGPEPDSGAWLNLMDEIASITEGDQVVSNDDPNPTGLDWMDDVDAVTGGGQDSSELAIDEIGPSSAGEQFDQDWGLQLPAGYQALDDVLQQRWL